MILSFSWYSWYYVKHISLLMWVYKKCQIFYFQITWNKKERNQESIVIPTISNYLHNDSITCTFYWPVQHLLRCFFNGNWMWKFITSSIGQEELQIGISQTIPHLTSRHFGWLRAIGGHFLWLSTGTGWKIWFLCFKTFP